MVARPCGANTGIGRDRRAQFISGRLGLSALLETTLVWTSAQYRSCSSREIEVGRSGRTRKRLCRMYPEQKVALKSIWNKATRLGEAMTIIAGPTATSYASPPRTVDNAAEDPPGALRCRPGLLDVLQENLRTIVSNISNCHPAATSAASWRPTDRRSDRAMPKWCPDDMAAETAQPKLGSSKRG